MKRDFSVNSEVPLITIVFFLPLNESALLLHLMRVEFRSIAISAKHLMLAMYITH